MQAGPVFPLDNSTFLADHLDGVEHAVPQAHAGDGESRVGGALHVDEHPRADNINHQIGDDRRQREHLPVAFVDEHPEMLSEENGNLPESAFVTDVSFFRGSAGFLRLNSGFPDQILFTGGPFRLVDLVFFDEFVGPAFAAFVFGIDPLDDVFQGIRVKEILCFLNSAVESQLTHVVFRSLGKNDHLIKQV